jgi:hypothetical protein
MRSRRLSLPLALALIFVTVYAAPPAHVATPARAGLNGRAVSERGGDGVARRASGLSQSASDSVAYLARVMDQFHDRFPVYDDVSSAGNHFPAFGKIPDTGAPVEVNGSSTDSPHSGATAMRFELHSGGEPFGGFYLLNGILPDGATTPSPNFGTVPDAGLDLTGAVSLSFWARGEHGGEKVDFFMGGVGRDAQTGSPVAPFPDSTPRRPALGSVCTLTTAWQQFTIDLTGAPLDYVLGGFAWVASTADNPSGAVFYVDDVQYNLGDARRAQRLNEPRFLRSFDTAPVQSQPAPVNDFDLRFRNAAFTYDNAIALLAFLADGSADGLRRARLIGDAFVYAAQHDRTFDDGRLRSVYAAGDLQLPPGWTPHNRPATAAVPGFFDEATQQFQEVGQESVDTGNNAWAMIALLALYRQTSNQSYLDAARKVGNFIRTFRNDAGAFEGFQGGIDFPEAVAPAQPSPRAFASTEHNLDVYAAFAEMFRLTGEPQWLDGARHARQFVEAMFETTRGCYLAGTKDPATRNADAGQLPLDVQAWSVLALPDALGTHPQALGCVEANHRNQHDGFDGFDFNDDRDGVWFEGTAQVATAYAFASRGSDADAFRQTLRQAQQAAPPDAAGGVIAAGHDGVSTGFRDSFGTPISYFRRVHVGATSWNAFAQLGFNPYYQTVASAGVVQFAAESLSAGEGSGSVQINVRRFGDTSAPASVGYSTSDGTASERGDYTAAVGTLRFAAGETTQSFSVLLTDDATVEGDETVNVTLDSPSGASLGSPSKLVLTINDNDTTATAANPIDDPSFFVRQHYHDFLSREPDGSGLQFWTQGITSCGADANCTAVKRINTSAAFFLSIEFQETGYLVQRIYKTAFGDATGSSTFPNQHQLPVPVVRLREFLRDTQRIGQGVVVGQGDWQTQLENNKQAFALEFVQQQRFTDAFPPAMSAADFVNKLDQNAGGVLTADQKAQLVSALGATPANPSTRAPVLRQVAENAALRQREFNRAFVLMQYFGYLRRNPNDAPDSDYTGYDFWLQKLNQFNGDFVKAEMVKAFLSSIEYRQRFDAE